MGRPPLRCVLSVSVLTACLMVCFAATSQAEVVLLSSPEYAKLTGYVYADLNATCKPEVGEAVIPNVVITLQGITTGGDPVTLQAVSDAQGIYTFPKILPGTYSVTETQPVEFMQGKYNLKQPGTVGGIPVGQVNGPDQFVNVVLRAGDSGVHYDFGEWGLRSAYVSKRYFLAYSEDIPVVPEPASAILLATGMMVWFGLAGVSRKRDRN